MNGQAMIVLSEWQIDKGEFHSSGFDVSFEILCWDDFASPLCVSRLGPDADPSADEVYRLRIGSELIVDIYPDHRIITRAATTLPPATVNHFLADIVLPRLLSHDGELVIHAGGVRIGDGGLMFVGLSGRGKSTLATSLHRAGFDLLGDDAMIIFTPGTEPLVRAVYPSLRLFPDSIGALIPDTVAAEPVSPKSPKHRIDLSDQERIDEPTPLRAIFSIGEPSVDHVSTRRLSPAETCMALVENSFALDPSDTGRASARLSAASALARIVPAFEIAYPRDYARLPDVHQAILDQVAALEPA